MRMRLVFSNWDCAGDWTVLAPTAAQDALLGVNACIVRRRWLGRLYARIATSHEKTCREKDDKYAHQKSPGMVWFSYAGSSMSCVR